MRDVTTPPRRRKEPRASGVSALAGIGLSLPFVLVMAGMMVYPLVKLVALSVEPPGLSANVSAFFDVSVNLDGLRATLVDSLLVTVIAMLLGAFVAWSLVTTRRASVRALLMVTIFLPFAMNTILKAFAFSVLLQTNGVVNSALVHLGLVHSPLNLLYTQLASDIGMVYWLFPYSALPLYVTFLSLDRELIDVGESLGASRLRALWTIAVPLAAPGIFATAVINYVLALGFFVIPVILGGPQTPFTSSLIWQDVTDFDNIPGAALSSLFLLVAALLVLLVGSLAVGRKRLIQAAAT